MNNLIELTDFKGKYDLPQKNSEIMIDYYTSQINVMQDDLLKDLLGYSFYLELKKAVEDSELEDDPIELDIKWVELLNGVDIVEDDINYHYLGIKFLLVIYCYIKFIETGYLSINTSNISIINNENSEVIDPTFFLIRLNNQLFRFVFDSFDSYIPLYAFLDFKSNYPKYVKTKNINIKNFI